MPSTISFVRYGTGAGTRGEGGIMARGVASITVFWGDLYPSSFMAILLLHRRNLSSILSLAFDSPSLPRCEEGRGDFLDFLVTQLL